MKRPLPVFLVLALSTAFWTWVEPAGAAPLQAGLARVDITPPVPYRMSGYFRERPSTGIHDSLLAKAVVFAQDGRQVALVFCDLIGVPYEVTAKVRRQVEQQSGIPAANIVLAATHTHTGPLYCGFLRQHYHDRAMAEKGHDPYEKVDYPAQLVKTIVGAVVEAKTSLQPVILQAGVAKQEGLAFNRRFHMKEGPVRFNPRVLNPNIVRPAGPIDPDVGLLLVRRSSDRHALASLSVFALHLDTTGGTRYSADYPYYLSESLKQKFSQPFVSLFGLGTCGDINHVDVTKRRRPSAREIGEQLATTVKEEVPRLEEVSRPLLAMVSETIPVPLQKYTAEEAAWAEETMRAAASGTVPFLDQVKACRILDLKLRGGDTLPIEVQVVRFGEELALVALPGEVFVDLGLAIKRTSPFATTLVIELANDVPAYIPTQEAFVEGSYETVNSRAAPGSGERMVQTAVHLLGTLRPEGNGS